MAHPLLTLAALAMMSAWPCVANAGSEGGRYVAPVKRGADKDSMTMQECRDRLNAPANERPASDDPRVNLDAMCRNMLSMDKAFHESQKAKAASAAAPRRSRPAASGQPQPR